MRCTPNVRCVDFLDLIGLSLLKWNFALAAPFTLRRDKNEIHEANHNNLFKCASAFFSFYRCAIYFVCKLKHFISIGIIHFL